MSNLVNYTGLSVLDLIIFLPFLFCPCLLSKSGPTFNRAPILLDSIQIHLVVAPYELQSLLLITTKCNAQEWAVLLYIYQVPGLNLAFRWRHLFFFLPIPTNGIWAKAFPLIPFLVFNSWSSYELLLHNLWILPVIAFWGLNWKSLESLSLWSIFTNHPKSNAPFLQPLHSSILSVWKSIWSISAAWESLLWYKENKGHNR